MEIERSEGERESESGRIVSSGAIKSSCPSKNVPLVNRGNMAGGNMACRGRLRVIKDREGR